MGFVGVIVVAVSVVLEFLSLLAGRSVVVLNLLLEAFLLLFLHWDGRTMAGLLCVLSSFTWR
jgi:hypothetical protein